MPSIYTAPSWQEPQELNENRHLTYKTNETNKTNETRRWNVETYRLKIKDLKGIKEETDRLKSKGKKIVFTNGCFDILHPGHTRYLYAARRLGDYLVVAVNSDRSTRAIKGPSRPINSQEARTELLAALGFVDGVVIFDEEDPFKVIELLMPNILVKGGDWAEDEIIGSDVVKKGGGEVKRIPYILGHATTDIIKKIRES